MKQPKTADWSSVKDKAYELVANNKVDIIDMSTYSILCKVRGDHDTYEVYVNSNVRVTKDNDINKANWFCGCKWGSLSNNGDRPHDGKDSYGSVKSNNRLCSHAYAAYLVLQQYIKWHRQYTKNYGAR